VKIELGAAKIEFKRGLEKKWHSKLKCADGLNNSHQICRETKITGAGPGAGVPTLCK
jgi:hypothetical protein